MCYTVYMTVACTLQIISRVILTALLAVEDLCRQVIHIVHSYLSSCVQCFAMLPPCFAYCAAKQYYSTNMCIPGCFSNTPSPCGSCIIIIALILLLILVYAYWLEGVLAKFGISIPCRFFRNYVKTTTDKPSNKFNTKRLFTDFIRSGKTTDSVRIIKEVSDGNYLDYPSNEQSVDEYAYEENVGITENPTSTSNIQTDGNFIHTENGKDNQTKVEKKTKDYTVVNVRGIENSLSNKTNVENSVNIVDGSGIRNETKIPVRKQRSGKQLFSSIEEIIMNDRPQQKLLHLLVSTNFTL